MKRDVDYTWRLAELMASNQMHNSTDLIPRLHERGITLSRPQVYRLVHQRPERVSLKLIAALCDIFGCGPEVILVRGRTGGVDALGERLRNAHRGLWRWRCER